MRINSSIDRYFAHEISRLGHTCVAYRDHILVWGGYSDDERGILHGNKYKEPEDLWHFNPLTETWFVRKCTGKIPPGLSGATSAVIDDKMYIFGGYADTSDGHVGTSEGHVGTLYCLDLNTYEWQLIDNAKGTPPVASDKSVSWVHDNKLYIFGGYGSPNVETSVNHLFSRQHNLQFSRDISSVWNFRRGWNNQFVEYDPVTNQWDWPAYSGDCPASRAAHSVAVLGDNIYIFGGRNNQKRLNDLYCLNMKTRNWRQIHPRKSRKHLNRQEVDNMQGSQNQLLEGYDIPCCRSWTSFTPLNDSSIMLYGGFSQDEEVLDDCWIFDLKFSTWLRVNLPFSRPRIWHTGTRSNDDEIIILGGSAHEVTGGSSNLTPPTHNQYHQQHASYDGAYSDNINGQSAGRRNDKTRLYCEEILTLSASPRKLFRLALEQAANVDYKPELLRQVPTALKRLLCDRKMAKKGPIISHGH